MSNSGRLVPVALSSANRCSQALPSSLSPTHLAGMAAKWKSSGSSGAVSTLRAMAASTVGASRSALALTWASSRSLNSGSTWVPNSSSDSQMCSWRFLPACMMKISWSIPASSNRTRKSRICFGVPVAPRSPVMSPEATLAPSRSSARAASICGE